MQVSDIKNPDIARAVAFVTAPERVPYGEAVKGMEAHVHSMLEGQADERVWLLEHPPVYTAGTSAKGDDLLDPRFPVIKTGRGGEYTYHGPGQRVAYVMLDLDRRRQRDLRRFVFNLEEWAIRALGEFNIKAERREGRVGLWVATQGTEKKIAAIGVRVRKWVTFHGLSINVEPDLSHFGGIVPCGIREFGVTSMHDLGHLACMDDLDDALKFHWDGVFEA